MRKVTLLLAAAAVFGATGTVARPVEKVTLASLEASTEATPGDAIAWLNLGMGYRQVGRQAEADAAFKRVMQLDNATVQDRFDGDHWSHRLAMRAMGTPLQVSSR